MRLIQRILVRVSGRAAFGLGAGLLVFAAQARAERWVRVQTEHFTLYSAALTSEAREILEKLEQFREVVLKTTRIGRGHDRRIDLFLFGSAPQMEPYAPLYKGKPKVLGGLFVSRPDCDTIMMYAADDIDRSVSVIYHEYMHALVRSRDIHLPPWLNEGLAELYETVKISRSEVEIGLGNPYHVLTLRKAEPLPLATLFAVKHGSTEYNESQRRTIFYAQSWALVHMIFQGKNTDLRTKLGKFMGLIQRERGPNPDYSRAFETAFEMPMEAMEKSLRDYVQDGSYTYAISTPEKLGLSQLPKTLEFTRLSAWESDLMLTILRARTQRSADTAVRLRELAEREPNDPRPHDYLGIWDWEQGEPQSAMRHWKQAMQLGSANAFVCVKLAEDVLKPVAENAVFQYRMPEELCLEIRGYAERALQLEPLYDEAWEALAQVEACAASPRRETLQQIEEAVAKLRHQGKVQLALALAYCRLGEIAKAELALKRAEALPRRYSSLPTSMPPPVSAPALSGSALSLPMNLSVRTPLPAGRKTSVRSLYSLIPELKKAIDSAKAKQAEAAAESTLVLDDLDTKKALK